MDILSLIGSLLSLIGIIITLYQISKVKKAAEAGKEAAETTKETIQKTLVTIDAAKYCQIIPSILANIKEGQIKLALHLCRELHEALIDLEESRKHLKAIPNKSFSQEIKLLGTNIVCLQNALFGSVKDLDTKLLTKQLESLRAELSQIRSWSKQNT